MTPGFRRPSQHSIGGRVRQLRETLGMSQADLADKAGLNPSVISRLENGGTEPHRSTLKKIEQALDLEEGTLAPPKTSRVLDSSRGTVRIGFPHSVMAAHLIPLALEGSVPGVEFCSFADLSKEPQWLPGTTSTDSPSAKSDPLKIRPYVGNALKRLLDNEQADLVVSWGALVRGLPSYKRVAQVSFGLSHCNIVAISKKGQTIGRGPFDRLDPRQAADNSDRYIALYPESINDFVHRFQLLQGKQISQELVKFSEWTSIPGRLLDCAKRADVIYWFGWEPYKSWIKNVLPGSLEVRGEMELGLYFHRSDLPPFSSLDLIARTDDAWTRNWVANQRMRSDGLFSILSKYVGDIERALLNRKANAVLSTIAAYFHMDVKTLSKRLRKFDLETRFYD